jgi:hypothetical protein
LEGGEKKPLSKMERGWGEVKNTKVISITLPTYA